MRVVGVYDDKGGLLAKLTFDNRWLASAFGERKDAFGLVGVRPGQDVKVVEQRVKGLLDRDFPSTEVLTAKEFKDQQAGQVNQLLGLIYALLVLAIIVSLFGIVNTLVLSISERTRELGMLRAIGTSRRQVKRMIRWEAVITSLIGGVVGAVLGTILAVLFTRRARRLRAEHPGAHAARPARAGRAGGRGGRGAARAAGGAPGRARRAGLRVAARVERPS